MESHKVYWFGKCRYETRRLILYCDDEEVSQLQPLHRGLLVYFLTHPKTVIPRRTLQEVGWGQIAVERDALNRAISELRQRLGSPGRESKYIKTVDGVGYEFIEEIKVEEETEANNAASDARPTINEAGTVNQVNSEDETKNNSAPEPAADAPLATIIAAPPIRTSQKKLILSALIILLAVAATTLAFRPRPTLESIEPSQPLSHIGDQPILIHGGNFGSWLKVRVLFPPDPGKNEAAFADLTPSAITWHGKHTATCLIDFNSRPFPHQLQLRHPLGLHSNILPITVEALIQTPVIDGIAPGTLKAKNYDQLILVYGAHFQQGPQVNLRFPDGSQRPLNPELVERTSPGVIRLRLYFSQEGQYAVQVVNNNGEASTPFNLTVAGR